MWPLKNKVLQRRLSVDPGKIINSYETRSLGQTKRPSYSNSPQPRQASKHSLVAPYYLENDRAWLNFSSPQKHLKMYMYVHVRVKYIFQPLSYIQMYMDLRSVHPKSLRDQRTKGYFSSHNNYEKKNKQTNPAEQYGKVQLLTCLSHTRILSFESIITLPPLKTAPFHLTSERNLPAS